jgi:uncharacterized protein
MHMGEILNNHVLISGLIAWFLAQALKAPVDYLQTHKWKWALSLGAGGMPSSHSSLITSTAMALGLHYGFDNPIFGLAVAVAMIVVYDAAGIRRQAGMQAQKINVLVEELLQGHPISQDQLKEVLGHTPIEAIGGVILGLSVAIIAWLILK